MSEKDIKNLIELAQSQSMVNATPQEALEALVRAGIFTPHGDYTAPFQELLVEAGQA